MRSVDPKARLIPGIAALWFLALAVDIAGAQDKAPRRVVSEKRLGSIGAVDLLKRDPKEPTYWISPDGRHFAYVTDKGIMIDGQAKEYEFGVEPKSFSFSPDSQRTAYVARVSDPSGRAEILVVDGKAGAKRYSSLKEPVFSPDSKVVACIARLSPASFDQVVLIDGREGEPHEDLTWELAFTADSRRVVYGVKSGDLYKMREDSVDRSAPPTERAHGAAKMVDNFFFGPGGQLGYIAKADTGFFVFYDGKEEALRFKTLDAAVLLSADGRHHAYLAEPSNFRTVAVLDGKPSKEYGGLQGSIVENTLAISPDGLRMAFVVKVGNKAFAVVDGRDGKTYSNVGRPVFSPDSQRVAYLASNGDNLMAVVDGQESAGFDDMGSPVFSPDSKSVAFWAEAAKRQFLVLNGERQKAYDDVDRPVFSADGKRMAYIAKAGDKSMLVDSGKEQKPYEDIERRFYFSADGRHLASVVTDGDKEMVVVDGIEGNRYDTVVTLGARIHFDSGDRLHYLAAKGKDLYLVEETIQQ